MPERLLEPVLGALILGAPTLGLLILVLPWLVSVPLSERLVAWVSRLALGGGLLGVALASGGRAVGLLPEKVALGTWWAQGDTRVEVGLLLDGPGLGYAGVGAALTAAAALLSERYLHRERGFQRFFAVLCLTQLSALLLGLSSDALLSFAGWEGLGLGTWLLVGFHHHREDTSRFATQAFVVNRIGDAAFLLAVALMALWLGDTSWAGLASRVATVDELDALALACCFGLAAAVKAGQLPFSFWLSRAMEGPTPSSALFYGAVATHGGVLLALRASAVLHVGVLASALLVALGALSALYGASVSPAQTDIKSALAFGAIGQLGLMFVWVGLGWGWLALLHMVAHAVVRAVQLFHAPGVVHDPPVLPVRDLLQRSPSATSAALNRGWLEELVMFSVADPLRTLSRDLDRLDAAVLSRATGSPARRAFTGLAGWREARVNPSPVGVGRGVVGRLTQWAASALARLEDQLVLRAIGQGLPEAGGRLGLVLNRVELALGRLWVLVVIVAITLAAVV